MNDKSQFRLVLERRFGPFFLAQLLGAFNDNLFKNALVILVTYHAADYSRVDPNVLTNVAAGLFILPFLLFSASAGQLADKFDKALLIRAINAAGLCIALIAGIGFYLKSVELLLAALFLEGLHSAFFGPVKYSILPQTLRPEELIGGNGLVEMGTFVAILVGTIVAGLLVTLELGRLWVSGLIVLVAALGLAASFAIPRLPASDPRLAFNWNPVSETWRNLGVARSDRAVYLSLLGISWFWFYGALFLSQFPVYSKSVLGGSEHVVTLLLALFSIGVAAGSLLCERLSGHKVEIGLVPFGSIGLSLFAVDLFFATPHAVAHAGLDVSSFLARPGSLRIAADLFLIGLFGGFYIVPLYALIQARCEPSHRSRIIAANNILNALFIVAAVLVAVAALEAGATIPQLLLLTGLLNALVAAYIYTLVPEFLLRFVAWLLVHSVYRLKTRGLHHVPEEGAALLVCNHQSLADALVVSAAVRRPIRFVMYHAIFDIPLLSFVFRSMKAIPIAGAREDAARLEQAYDAVAAALADGQLVCIFPEGGLTRDGAIGEFRPGMTRILERTPVPVVPLALDGLWRSVFSRNRERWRVARLFPTVRLAAGAPLEPAAAAPAGVREIVAGLQAGATPAAPGLASLSTSQ